MTKILIVDDDESVREILKVTIAMIGGWDVVAAESGLQALAMAADESPDAILLDVVMPGLDGPATYGHLQEGEETAHIPVIFLTAEAQAGDRDAYDRLGVAGTIAKPFDPLTLPDEINGILGWAA